MTKIELPEIDSILLGKAVIAIIIAGIAAKKMQCKKCDVCKGCPNMTKCPVCKHDKKYHEGRIVKISENKVDIVVYCNICKNTCA